MSHQEELEKKKYRNWVRGGLAYKYLKEGIKGFADEVVEEEHRRINQDVIAGRSCNQCSNSNLRPLHTCKYDHAGRKKCPWGQNSCNCLYTKKQRCPNKVCDAIMEEILKNHGSTPPSPNWKNTDMQKWCSDPWEIAKCFINAPGYSDKYNADDIDISGLLHVFISNISHKSHLSDKINNGNIFLKILQRRNELFHSPTMEMEDSKLHECIDEIIAILEDEKELKARHDAQKAVLNLKQLKQQNFVITTHNEVDVCRDALTSITNKAEELKQTIQDAKDDIARKQAEATEAVGDEAKKVLRDVLGESDNQNKTLHERVGRLEQRLMILEGKIDKLDTIRQNHKKQLDYAEGKQVLQKKMVELYQNHYVGTSVSPLKLQENNINIKDVYVPPEMVVEEKTNRNASNQMNKPNTRSLTGYRDMLQTNGQKHKQIYIIGDVGTGKSTFCKMMIQDWCSAVTEESPTSANNDKSKDPHKSTESEKNVDPVPYKDYAPVSDNDEYLTTNKDDVPVSDKDDVSDSDSDATHEYVDPVTDKHAGNKYNDPVSENDESSVSYSSSELRDLSDSEFDYESEFDCEYFVYEYEFDYESEFDCESDFDYPEVLTASGANISEMRNCDFLFFVPLQRMSGLSDITEMIKAFITAADLASTDLIDRIFQQESERCLILADGLDEWTPPKTKSILPHFSYGLPKRNRANHATVVTLSRPSAIGILNMKSSECDQKVKLLGINSRSVKCLIDKYLAKFRNTGLSCKAFMKIIKVSELEHLEKTPLLLQQLVWLYGFGYEIGKSVSDTYSHLVNIVLGWSQNEKEGNNLEQGEIGGIKQDKQQLPRLLRRFPKCEAKKRLLFSLASLAFEALTSDTRSSTFGRSYLLTCGVSEDAITSLIKLGILTEENCFDPTYESTMLEFVHISYLEFFAAVHVSGKYNNDQCSIHQNNILEELFQNCKSAADILQLSNVLKMICGLSPYIIPELSKMISDIVFRDESMITHRSSLKVFLWNDPIQELDQIQRLMLDCLSEGDSDDQPLFSLCDVIINPYIGVSFLQRIIPDNVFHLDARKISDIAVWRWIVQLKRLQYLYIGDSVLPHSELVLLSSFIQETPLRSLILDDVNCIQYDCEGHTIDLFKHGQLQLQILKLVECNRVIIPNINTKHLEILHFGLSSTIDINLLLNASTLTELQLGPNQYPIFTYNKQVDSVIHTLHYLRKLVLSWVCIETNAFTVTPEMKNLENIEVRPNSMSLETWRTFVDGLLTLQQSVSVSLKPRYPTDEIDKDKCDYVRQNKMFEMIEDSGMYFKFSTKNNFN